MKKNKLFKPVRNSPKKVFTPKDKVDTGRGGMYKSATWAEFRVSFLQYNTTCYVCGNPSRIVDHIVAHKGDVSLFWQETNYIPLCKKDHDFITAAFDRHSPPKTEEKMKWIHFMRESKNISTRVKVLPLPLKIKGDL